MVRAPGAGGWQRRPQARADSVLFTEPPQSKRRVFLRRKGLILLRPFSADRRTIPRKATCGELWGPFAVKRYKEQQQSQTAKSRQIEGHDRNSRTAPVGMFVDRRGDLRHRAQVAANLLLHSPVPLPWRIDTVPTPTISASSMKLRTSSSASAARMPRTSM